MAVRISFSKPLDPDSFYNENGDIDKITITQGMQTFTADGDIDVNSEDITDRFIIDDSIFSLNQKMITLKFKKEAISEGYASQASVSINISKEIKDKYGFTMVDDNEIAFKTGSQFDTLAPRITYLTAGSGKSFQDFQGVYKDNGTILNLGKYTKLTEEGTARVLIDGTGIKKSNMVLYAVNDFARDNPELIEAFIKATDRGAQYITDNPEEAAKILAPRYNVTEEEMIKIFGNFNFSVSLTEEDIQEITTVADYAYEAGIISNPVDGSEFINTSYLKEAGY
jgi:hypothetical protein